MVDKTILVYLFHHTVFSPFSDAVIEQANWDASKVRDKLHRDIEAHASLVRSEKLSEVLAEFEVFILAK